MGRELESEVEKLCESVDGITHGIQLLSLALYAAEQILAKEDSAKSKDLYAEVKVLRRNFYRALERSLEEGKSINKPSQPTPRPPFSTRGEAN